MTQWTPADEAFAHVLAIELVPDVADHKLKQRILMGEIPARADRLSFRGTDQADTIVPSDFWDAPGHWIHIEINFAKRVAVRKYYSLVQKTNTPIVPESVSRVSGLSFSTRHLQRCFPPAEADQKRHTGRPEDSGHAASDKLLFPEIRKLIEGKKLSATAATWEVIGRDGKGAVGSGGPDSKMKRVRDRYKSSGK